jgi:hypothetical protein
LVFIFDITGANRQRDPLVPRDGAECFRTGLIAKFDVERRGYCREPDWSPHRCGERE